MALLILFVKALFGALLFFTCSKYKYIEYEQIENDPISEIPPSYGDVPPPPPLPPQISINSNNEPVLEEPPKYND